MNDSFDDRIADALHAQATSTADAAAAHAEFLVRRRRREQRVIAGMAVAAVLAVTAGALAWANHHHGKAVPVAANGRTSELSSGPRETLSPPTSDATAVPAPASGPTPSTTARRSTTTTNAPSLPTTPGHPTTTTNTAPALCCPPPPGTVVVTNADNGKSYTLVRGQQLWVQLQPDGYIWTEPESSDSAALPRTGGGTRSDGSASATFTAAAIGSADVSSSGRSIPPPCATATPRCMVPDHIVEFTVHVTVLG